MISLFRQYEYGAIGYIVWAILILACISVTGTDKLIIGAAVSFGLQLGAVIASAGILAIYAVAKVADQVRPLRVDIPPVDPIRGPHIP